LIKISLFAILYIILTGNINPAGIYSLTKGHSYQWSVTTIEIDCDFILLYEIETHGGRTSFDGTWSTKQDTLRIELKLPVSTDIESSMDFKKVQQFLIRKNKLIPLITSLDQDGITNETATRLNRKYRKNKYKKIEEKGCN
jgi:hypothetical protein